MKNWKTTVTGTGSAIFALLGSLALLPHTMEEIGGVKWAELFPPKVKAWITVIALGAACILKIINSVVQKDADPKP